MVVRGNFRPPTLVTADVLNSSYEQFIAEPHVDPNKAELMSEITLDYLTQNGSEIDEADYLARAELLCAMGRRVIISNCNNHQILINFLSNYKIRNLGIVIGVHQLSDIIKDKYEQNSDGRILAAFGELFTRHIKIYAYPAYESEESNKLITAENLPVPQEIKFLYRHLLDSEQIVGITGYDADQLHIFPYKVYEQILNGDRAWEASVPPFLVNIIKEKGLFTQNMVEA